MQNDACPSGLFFLRIPEFESDQPGILNSPAAMLFGLPRRQRLPKSLPQLHIRHAAAQTRTVSAAPFRPNPRMVWRQFKWILFLTDTGVRVLPPQPRSGGLRGRSRTVFLKSAAPSTASMAPIRRRLRRCGIVSHGVCCIEEVEEMTGKTIRELALDAIDQALAESIRQQFISMKCEILHRRLSRQLLW